jgi:hypothetical protein
MRDKKRYTDKQQNPQELNYNSYNGQKDTQQNSKPQISTNVTYTTYIKLEQRNMKLG